MGKTAFDKELSTYLLRRRKGAVPELVGWLKGFMPKSTPPPVKVELPSDVQTYEDETSVKETKKTVVEYETEKTNVFSFIMNKFKFSKKPVSHVDQESQIKDIVAKEMTQKDLREVAKIALVAIKKLPVEDMNEFKESSEFDVLKRILKKHDLIK